jgi:protein-tyrosine phosphatase
MIDIQTHILPGMDDGSRDIQESLCMLRACGSQTIDICAATPHYYREAESVEQFIIRRSDAWKRLFQGIEKEAGLPKVVLGAEVRFFDGMGHREDLRRLCLGGGRCLLLEMPIEPWSRRQMAEVNNLLSVHRLSVVLAHAERYLPVVGKNGLYELSDMGAILQINTSSLAEHHLAGRRVGALGLCKAGCACVLGTDCHNMEDRPPEYDKGREVIVKKLGLARLMEMETLAKRLSLEMG